MLDVVKLPEDFCLRMGAFIRGIHKVFVHAKLKGNIGELAVATDLAKRGFCVFTELGDLSKVDLIAEKHNKLYKVQVKATTINKGKIALNVRKCGPNYKFTYTEAMVDVFAVYILNHGGLFYVPSKEVCVNNTSLTFRVNLPKNKQQKKVRFWEDYRHFPEVIEGP